MALNPSSDLDALLLELRQSYIGIPQQEMHAPQPPPFPIQQQPQQNYAPQISATKTPELPPAAPLQPSMTASLAGLRPGFQVNPAQQMQMPEAIATAPMGGSPLLAQRLQSFMNPSPNSQLTAGLGQQNKPEAAPGWASTLGNAALGFAATPQGSQAIGSGLGMLGGAAAAHPYLAGIGALGALGAGGYYYANRK